MLTHLRVQNFKSIGGRAIDIPLKPLTILVGPNGAGKSAIWESLVLLAQSVNGPLQPAGKLFQFPSLLDLAHRQDAELWITIEVRDGGDAGGYRCEYQPSTGQVTQSVLEAGEPLVQHRLVGDQRTGFSASLYARGKDEVKGAGNTSGILAEWLFRNDLWKGYSDTAALERAEALLGALRRHFLDGLFFLNAERGRVPPAMPGTLNATWVGPRGEEVLSILALVFGARRYQPVEEQITRYARRFELLGLKAGPRQGNQVSADYLDPVLKIPLNLSLASFGARQLIPIITQLFWAPRDATVIVEDPEMSLHPELQIRLLELFGAAIDEGKQVLLTTHSHFFLLGLHRALTRRWLRKEDVAFYHVQKRRAGTTATPIAVNEEGYLARVPSFMEVERGLMDEWAESLGDGAS